MKRLIALALLCSLTGCDTRNGRSPAMECKQRDIKSGLCTEAKYSCWTDDQMLAYYVEGPICYGRDTR